MNTTEQQNRYSSLKDTVQPSSNGHHADTFIVSGAGMPRSGKTYDGIEKILRNLHKSRNTSTN